METPSLGISVDCHSDCVQCCPSKLRIFCCCCKVEEDGEADKPPLKGRVTTESKSKEAESEKTQYVCVHRVEEESRTDSVAIAAIEARKEPEKRAMNVRCTIL